MMTIFLNFFTVDDNILKFFTVDDNIYQFFLFPNENKTIKCRYNVTKVLCIEVPMVSLSESISDRFLVPSTFL